MQARDMVPRVKNELKVHIQLKHPSVLELYNCFEDKDYVYLVLELCHNGELNRFLKTKQKKLKEAEGTQAKRIAKRIINDQETHIIITPRTRTCTAGVK